MALATQARRIGAATLLALMLLAVVSPACLVAVPSAAAMTGPHDACDSDSGQPTACPHHEEMQVDAVVSGASDQAFTVAVLPLPAAGAILCLPELHAATPELPGTAPPTGVTPLLM